MKQVVELPDFTSFRLSVKRSQPEPPTHFLKLSRSNFKM